MEDKYGPKTNIAAEIHASKYRGTGESFEEYATRVANALGDGDEHFFRLKDILGEQRFLPGGRIQSAIGSPRNVTAFNCFVSQTIPDSMEGIMDSAKFAALTMKKGGGIGYDFSTLRPSGDLIVSLDSPASGPLSFMEIFNSTCQTVSSAGNRRGAQMAVLNVSHPDIEQFVEAKTNSDSLTAFNISVGVSDSFMEAVDAGGEWDLTFNNRVYGRVDARRLWEKIMRATWDWAEPGILFIDRINEMNNLWYCETISATNPCGEQPLPPNGACLLGSFNLTKYILDDQFDYGRFAKDIHEVVRAMDNVIDNTVYPLPEQEWEAKSKRRMGLGVTGLANTLELLGYEYGSPTFLKWTGHILSMLANESYMASSQLAIEKGVFPAYDWEKYPEGEFIKRLDQDVQDHIREFGMRNSHLTSIAPTGTISLCADNVSSGIEPVFSHHYDRNIIKGDEVVTERVEDYNYRVHGLEGRTADQCSVDEHLGVLVKAQYWVDSACSKTINVGDDVTWEDFKDVYIKAWKGGCKGVTTFRAAGKRYGILNKVDVEAGSACYIDPETGDKTCD